MKNKLLLIIVLFTIQLNAQKQQKINSSWKSLEQYRCPDWFCDAKFGIWTCWNAYTVPATGDWYAREMYKEGSPQYKYHLEHYGHPSKVGYKDIVERWKGEKFDPDNLVALFKEAGAKYIVAMAVHHDNFDLWNSKYHEWNSVNHGPRQDIIGKWETAVRKSGLRWGVTSHLERSWNWFSVNKGADKTGEFAGVPYDGNDPKYAGLYYKKYDGYNDQSYRYAIDPPLPIIEDYFLRMKDLLDQHKPDLFYFDGGIPFGETGRKLISYYYNSNMKNHKGKLEAVMCIKNYASGPYCGDGYRNGVGLQDIESGQLSDINQSPWQTDISIGDWAWKPNDIYKSPKLIIHQLIDIVSKNGNLLLNIPPREDGTLDNEAISLLKEIGKWIKVNGEGIYTTRPYTIYGEGPTKVEGGHFKKMVELTKDDIRFTTKGDTIYAFVCGLPEKKISIKSFSKESYHKIKSVRMLGIDQNLNFIQTNSALEIDMPTGIPCDFAFCLKIEPELNMIPRSLFKY